MIDDFRWTIDDWPRFEIRELTNAFRFSNFAFRPYLAGVYTMNCVESCVEINRADQPCHR
jgi:hypothetical protein